MRIPVWLAVGGTALALAGCGGQGHSMTGAITTALTAQSPRQLAEANAASMLAAFKPPPGATSSGRIAVQVLSAPPEEQANPDSVLRTAWWRADGKPAAVLAWVRRAAQGWRDGSAEFTLSGSGSSGGLAADSMQFDEFTLPAVPGVLPSRWLLVSVADIGADHTAIRVDAEVDWLPPKPAAERIPKAAKVVTITPVAGLRPLPADDRPVTVTDPAKVARIAAVVDGLQLFPPGEFSCPADFGRAMRLTFRAKPVGTASPGPALAVVTGQTGGCGAVQVDIGGKPMPELWQSDQMQQQVIAIAGIRWPGFAGLSG
jgi:hypothetical protein